MYEIHDVYVAATPSNVFDSPVRVLETIAQIGRAHV